ncbi:MAG: nuclear transport factor 2 family protein [Pseudomonadota bacterium]
MSDATFPASLVKTGNALVAHCEAHTEGEALDTLYHPDCVSVEALPGPNGREAVGIEAIKAKHDWWYNAFEEHSSSASEPFFHAPDRFSVIFDMDVTEKESGQRMQMREVGLYTVDEAGLIIREEFFYAPFEG